MKEAGGEDIVRVITRHGIPVLIASDTSPPSHFVQKLAARFCIRVFRPRKSLTQHEKRMISQGIFDPHIRDSYAAAVKAYRRYANRLRQIDRMGVDGADELKRLAITGKRVSEALRQRN